MTASDLKYEVEQHGEEPYFFTRKAMKFFGDTMRNYGVRSTTIIDLRGDKIAVWELYRRKPVMHGLDSSAYFNKETFGQVFSN